MKTIEYFLDKETAYIKSREGENDIEWDEDIQEFEPADMNNPLFFLNDNWFHRIYDSIKTNTNNILSKLAHFQLSYAEGVMLLAYIGPLSKCFRDDYYGSMGVPVFVREMQNCLYSVIQKAPLYGGDILYRFCVAEDKVDFEIGQVHTFYYSLTTTTDNWEQDKNRYIIMPIQSTQTRAHCLYEIYDNGGCETQVNFLPNTTFRITDIKEIQKNNSTYKHIYMQEIN